MKPIDPRLLRYARATRGFLAAVVGLGAVGAGLVVAQAMLIAEIVVGSFQDGRSVGELRTPLLLLVAVAAGRGLVGWLTELAAHRASAAVKSELRGRLLDRATALGPGWLGGRSTGSLVTLATRGVDALDGYFSRYLPSWASRWSSRPPCWPGSSRRSGCRRRSSSAPCPSSPSSWC